MTINPLLSAADAGEHVGVSAATIRKWVSRGYLVAEYPSWATGKAWYRLSDVIACAEGRRSKAAEARLTKLADKWRTFCGVSSPYVTLSSEGGEPRPDEGEN